jgi:hypothetical protein
VDDRCQSGTCRGDALSCDDGNACTSDACDPSVGCLNPARDGLCDDGSACTRDDRCVNSACVGAPLPCDDGNPCTDDACEEDVGCAHVTNQAPCDDLSPCTTDDRCSDGACHGLPVLLDACRSEQCPSSSGPGPACDDANPCTAGDACSGGVCAGTPRWCATSPAPLCLGPATRRAWSAGGACDPGTGDCTYAFADENCAGGCVDGVCLAAPALTDLDLTAFGGVRLQSATHELRAVSTPWADGSTLSNASLKLTMGFEP